MDGLIQNVIQAALQARYDRITSGLELWPWSLWIFFWGFLAVLVFVILIVLYTTLLERKLIGWFQIRLGPNRVGPWGILQPFADMIKLLIKEDIVPRVADKALHLIAPLVIFIPTLLAFVVIPFAAGTVELPNQLVTPSFHQMWMEWIPAEDAEELGYDSAGFLEAEVAVEHDETYHKVWWVPRELDHEPLFIPAYDDGRLKDNVRYRFRNVHYPPTTLPIKPESGTDPTEYAVFYAIVDYESPGRDYDILEIDFLDTPGHSGIIELGLDGDQVDSVEKQYAKMLKGTRPDLPWDERFDFDGFPPMRWFERVFTDFADSVALNNRNFGPDSMEPVFGMLDGNRVGWRDLYTPDWKHDFWLHGAEPDPGDENAGAGLVFFDSPESNDAAATSIDEFDLETLDWKEAGALFRISRITETGWLVETRDGTSQELTEPGDSLEVTIDGTPARLTLKDTQYYTVYVVGRDLGVGILYILAVTSLAVVGIFMAGFGSNNKWSLYGSMRTVAQLISYEIPMTLAVLGPVIMAGTLSTVELVEAQSGPTSLWFVIPQFLAFFIFLVTMTAEVNRSPFDLPEAESELVAGFHTEYSGLKFGFFFLAEYANMFVAAAVMTVLFFGGWKGPFQIPFVGEFISSFFWFMIKAFFWLCVFVWFRATFPRFRIDQMMDYAWKVLLPISLLNIIYTGYISFSDWNFTIWAQNNWRIWEDYIKPLFVNVYTNYYAVPIIVIIALLLATDIYGTWKDSKNNESLPEEIQKQ